MADVRAFVQAQKFAGTAHEEAMRNAKSPMIAAGWLVVKTQLLMNLYKDMPIFEGPMVERHCLLASNEASKTQSWRGLDAGFAGKAGATIESRP